MKKAILLTMLLSTISFSKPMSVRSVSRPSVHRVSMPRPTSTSRPVSVRLSTFSKPRVVSSPKVNTVKPRTSSITSTSFTNHGYTRSNFSSSNFSIPVSNNSGFWSNYWLYRAMTPRQNVNNYYNDTDLELIKEFEYKLKIEKSKPVQDKEKIELLEKIIKRLKTRRGEI